MQVQRYKADVVAMQARPDVQCALQCRACCQCKCGLCAVRQAHCCDAPVVRLSALHFSGMSTASHRYAGKFLMFLQTPTLHYQLRHLNRWSSHELCYVLRVLLPHSHQS